MHWKLSVSCAEFKVAYFINHYLRFILAPQTWSPWTRCNRWLGAVKPFGKAPRLCGIGFIGGTSQGSSDVRSLKSRHVLFLLSCFLLHKTVPLKRWLSNYIIYVSVCSCIPNTFRSFAIQNYNCITERSFRATYRGAHLSHDCRWQGMKLSYGFPVSPEVPRFYSG